MTQPNLLYRNVISNKCTHISLNINNNKNWISLNAKHYSTEPSKNNITNKIQNNVNDNKLPPATLDKQEIKEIAKQEIPASSWKDFKRLMALAKPELKNILCKF